MLYQEYQVLNQEEEAMQVPNQEPVKEQQTEQE